MKRFLIGLIALTSLETFATESRLSVGIIEHIYSCETKNISGEIIESPFFTSLSVKLNISTINGYNERDIRIKNAVVVVNGDEEIVLNSLSMTAYALNGEAVGRTTLSNSDREYFLLAQSYFPDTNKVPVSVLIPDFQIFASCI